MKLRRAVAGIGSFFLFFGVFVVVGVVSADTTWNVPPSQNGTYLEWEPKSGTSHVAMVDESSCNGNVDYNRTNIVGARDSYGVLMYIIPTGSIITGIEVTPCASKNKSGGASSVMNVFYRLNGMNSSDASTYALTGTTPINLLPTSWSGLSVVKDDSTALEIGAVLASGNKGARLSKISVKITYTLPPPPPAPSNLSVFPTASSTAFLTWTDNSSDEYAFSIERSQNGVNFSHIATTSPNITSYEDVGLSSGTTYYYRLFAASILGGYSSYSNIASTTTN